MTLAFPLPALPPGSDRLRDEVRAFLDGERAAGCMFEPNGWMRFDARFSRRCGEQGYIGMTWPKRWGGQERSSIERYVVGEEMLAAGAPAGAHWIADRQSGPQIIRHGSDMLRQQVLPGIVRGEIFFAIGMSEPDAGSDLAAVRSTGTRVDGGWRLDGRKLWTTNGHLAHYMIGLFRTAPRDDKARHTGLTQFVIDLTADGIVRRPITDMSGRREFNEITFDGVFVPDSHVLGEPGKGWNLVVGELAFERSGPERFLSAFPLLAEATAAAGDAAGPLETREIGRLVAHAAALRAMSQSVAGQLASGRLPAVEAALVKDLGNAHEQETPEVLRRLALGSPMAGASSYQSMLADMLLSTPSFTLRGGTPEILRGIIARGLGLR